MSKDAITTTLKRLNTSIVINVPIIVEIKINSVKTLIETLENEQVLVITRKNSNSYLVKVKTEITAIEALPKFISTKKTQIPDLVDKFLANKEGYLILSTTNGIMTHLRAQQKHIGGQILGFIQFK